MTIKNASFSVFIGLLILHCSAGHDIHRSSSDRSSLRNDLRKERTVHTVSSTIFGKVSYYGEEFHGKPTASGEIYDMSEMTAAHRTLPFGTICRVTNLANNKTVLVRINDRGPFVPERILDLSKGAAQAIGGITQGIMEVKIEILEIPE